VRVSLLWLAASDPSPVQKAQGYPGIGKAIVAEPALSRITRDIRKVALWLGHADISATQRSTFGWTQRRSWRCWRRSCHPRCRRVGHDNSWRGGDFWQERVTRSLSEILDLIVPAPNGDSSWRSHLSLDRDEPEQRAICLSWAIPGTINLPCLQNADWHDAQFEYFDNPRWLFQVYPGSGWKSGRCGPPKERSGWRSLLLSASNQILFGLI
jgi:hypothetical protein